MQHDQVETAVNRVGDRVVAVKTVAIAPAPRSCHTGWKWCRGRAACGERGENHCVGSELTAAQPPGTSTPPPMQDRNDGAAFGIGRSYRHATACRSGSRSRLPGALALAGCGGFTETLQRGYVLQEGALEQIPIGATQEQVLIVLGTPSTVATVSGEAFYYISQTSQRSAAFMPYEVEGPARDRGLFRQGPPGRAAGQLRPEGRQDFRLRVADDADRRPGVRLPERRADAPTSARRSERR